mmetsp:Transcript_10066/g.18968  ORF Transcript_10066/g.18968 Transcript_10066/m.18968 type:complete len:338 (+) Transcript_10066:796-1809(+)
MGCSHIYGSRRCCTKSIHLPTVVALATLATVVTAVVSVFLIDRSSSLQSTTPSRKQISSTRQVQGVLELRNFLASKKVKEYPLSVLPPEKQHCSFWRYFPETNEANFEDGVWPVCDASYLHDQNDRCSVMSFGVGFDWRFELSLARQGCKVFMFDPTPNVVARVNVSGDLSNENLHFYPFGISKLSKRQTLRSNAWNNKKDASVHMISYEVALQTAGVLSPNILKIDIEGFEYAIIDEILSLGHLPHQLLLELHPSELVPETGKYAPSADSTLWANTLIKVLNSNYKMFWRSIGRYAVRSKNCSKFGRETHQCYLDCVADRFCRGALQEFAFVMHNA